MHGSAYIVLLGIATPALVLFAGSVVLVARNLGLGSVLQAIGAACLLVMALTHICEMLGLFPSMGWGLANSIGHNIDFVSATVGLSLFPLGYLLGAISR